MSMAEMTPERLAEIRQREQQATKGPWRVGNPPQLKDAIFAETTTEMEGDCIGEFYRDEQWAFADAAFTAHARQDIPDLLDALARAQQEIADLRRQAQTWALYAFNHHGNDAVLYNGLADLGGVTPDGDGWLAPRTPGEKA